MQTPVRNQRKVGIEKIMEEKKQPFTNEELQAKLKEKITLEITLSDLFDIRDSLVTRANCGSLITTIVGNNNAKVINDNVRILNLIQKCNVALDEMMKKDLEEIEQEVDAEETNVKNDGLMS